MRDHSDQGSLAEDMGVRLGGLSCTEDREESIGVHGSVGG